MIFVYDEIYKYIVKERMHSIKKEQKYSRGFIGETRPIPKPSPFQGIIPSGLWISPGTIFIEQFRARWPWSIGVLES